MKNLTLYVKEATREQPIQGLETALVTLDGIEKALIDMEDGEVKISYNENEIAQEEIIERIQQHGLHILD